MIPTNISKIAVLKRMLSVLGGVAYVHFDPKQQHCMVPFRLHGKDQVVLLVGHQIRPPIKLLTYDDRGMYGIFTFGGVEEACYVPMEAIFCITDSQGHGELWPGDMPKAVADALADQSRVAKLKVYGYQRPDGTYDLEAYRQHRKVRPWPPSA
jgi:hypothetical protein